MKRHIFVIATAFSIGITLSACGPAPADPEIANITRGIHMIFEKNPDS